MIATSLHTKAVTQEAEQRIRSIYMERRAAKLLGEAWTVHAYRQAIDQSPLKAPVKNTLHAMLAKAGGRHTTVDRATLCLITGVRRVATITTHWHQAREAGLLVSRQRWNSTSVHMFLIPGTQYSTDEALWGEPLDGWHVWSPEEDAWWDSLDCGIWITPPWGESWPQF